MQRGSSAMSRNMLIASVCIIALLTILYYMKRVEVGRLKKDMDTLGVSTRVCMLTYYQPFGVKLQGEVCTISSCSIIV